MGGHNNQINHKLCLQLYNNRMLSKNIELLYYQIPKECKKWMKWKAHQGSIKHSTTNNSKTSRNQWLIKNINVILFPLRWIYAQTRWYELHSVRLMDGVVLWSSASSNNQPDKPNDVQYSIINICVISLVMTFQPTLENSIAANEQAQKEKEKRIDIFWKKKPLFLINSNAAQLNLW